MLRSFLTFAILVLASTSLHAAGQPNKQDPEPIPAPKKIIEQPTPFVVPYVPQRQDTLEVWQHYGVGPLGRFVPRVIVTPYGPLTSRDLNPYPWAANRRTAVMPYAVD